MKTKYKLRKEFKRFLVCVFLLIIVVTSFSIYQKRKTINLSKTGFYFDTYISLSLYGPNSKTDKLNQLLDECMRKCAQYEDKFSATKEGSELYQINHAEGEWVMVSDDTIALLYNALSYANYTNGLIDPTILPVKQLWDFSPESDKQFPDQNALAHALTHVNFQKIEINGNMVRINDEESAIDLGFIAKGYIADEIKAYLLSEQVNTALINLGGNIQTIGHRPDGKPFKIGIQKPFANIGTYLLSVDACTDIGQYSSIVTSGIYERYFKRNDEIYHHILDTKTGYPVKTDLVSATILTNSSVHADALSTTCLILGLEKAQDLIDNQDGVDAIFITDTGDIIDTRQISD